MGCVLTVSALWDWHEDKFMWKGMWGNKAKLCTTIRVCPRDKTDAPIKIVQEDSIGEFVEGCRDSNGIVAIGGLYLKHVWKTWTKEKKLW